MHVSLARPPLRVGRAVHRRAEPSLFPGLSRLSGGTVGLVRPQNRGSSTLVVGGGGGDRVGSRARLRAGKHACGGNHGGFMTRSNERKSRQCSATPMKRMSNQEEEGSCSFLRCFPEQAQQRVEPFAERERSECSFSSPSANTLLRRRSRATAATVPSIQLFSFSRGWFMEVSRSG